MIEPYKPLYKIKEAAAILLVSHNTVYEMIRKGELKALKLGDMKIRGTDLEAFIEKYPVCNPEIMDRETGK